MMKKAISGTLVTFTFEGLEPLTFDATKASAENRAFAEMSRWRDRLGDMAAISKTDLPGHTVTEQMRRDAVEAGIRFYEAGGAEWEMGKTAKPTFNPQIADIAKARGISYDEAKAWYADHAVEIAAALAAIGKTE